MGRLILSERHGANPAIPHCFYCNKPKNEVILAGRMKGDAEAPRGMVWDDTPCDDCLGYMKAGVILISVNEALTDDMSNPYRSGGWVVVREDAVRRAFDPESAEKVCQHRFAFVTDETWDHLGLPRGSVEGVPDA